VLYHDECIPKAIIQNAQNGVVVRRLVVEARMVCILVLENPRRHQNTVLLLAQK